MTTIDEAVEMVHALNVLGILGVDVSPEDDIVCIEFASLRAFLARTMPRLVESCADPADALAVVQRMREQP